MTSPETPLQHTATELRMATFHLARRLRSARAVDTMSDAQLAVLMTLRVHGTQTVSSLATRERVTAPSMTNLINGLQEQGFVRRAPDTEDRRRVHVDLTDAGDDIVTRTVRDRDRLLAEMLAEADFTTDELATLRAASALMRKLLDR